MKYLYINNRIFTLYDENNDRNFNIILSIMSFVLEIQLIVEGCYCLSNRLTHVLTCAHTQTQRKADGRQDTRSKI